MSFILILLSFGLLVFVHELGHYLAARRYKMPVQRFSIGMGPLLFERRVGETDYQLRLLPLGGFVDIVGMSFPKENVEKTGKSREDKKKAVGSTDIAELMIGCRFKLVAGIGRLFRRSDERAAERTKAFMARRMELSRDERRLFRSQNGWHQLVVAAAGPVFSILLMYFGYIAHGLVGKPQVEDGPLQVTGVLSVEAKGAGILPGDRLLIVNGEDLSSASLLQAVLARDMKKATDLVVERGGQKVNLRVPIRKSTEHGLLGINIKQSLRDTTRRERLTWGIENGTVQLKFSAQIVIKFITGQIPLSVLSGPVGIMDKGSEILKQSPQSWLVLTAALSVGIGLMNLIPMLPLDGGRIVLALIKILLRGRACPRWAEDAVTWVGVTLLLAMFLMVTSKDVLELMAR